MRYVIGVDLGGTQLRACLADESGLILSERRMLTGGDDGPDAVIARITATIAEVRGALPEGGTVLGIGLGLPGPINPYTGMVYSLTNIPGWRDVPLRALLHQQTGLPVEIGNDANAAALGEWLFGGGRGVQNLVYITVSTGIGGGVIVDGRLLLGYRGAAAEVGHQIMNASGYASWENLAAGPGLAEAAAEAMIADPRSLLHSLATPKTVTSIEVAQAAAQGDPLAQRLLDREGELIGIGLVNMLYMFSPELILLGGGVAVHNPFLIDRAVQVIQERAFLVYRDIPVRLAALGDRAGLLGAVALFLHQHTLDREQGTGNRGQEAET